MFVVVVTFVETKTSSLMKYFIHFRRSIILRAHGQSEQNNPSMIFFLVYSHSTYLEFLQFVPIAPYHLVNHLRKLSNLYVGYVVQNEIRIFYVTKKLGNLKFRFNFIDKLSFMELRIILFRILCLYRTP